MRLGRSNSLAFGGWYHAPCYQYVLAVHHRVLWLQKADRRREQRIAVARESARRQDTFEPTEHWQHKL